jgi:hypothetical protein
MNNNKLHRISETTNTPDFMTDAFMGAQDDPYKELRQSQQERQMKIASQTMGNRRVVESQVPEWEHIDSQTEYVHPSMMREFDEALSRFSAADLNPNSVRRYDTGYDDGLNTRSANNLFVTEHDAINLIRSGASMWNPVFEDAEHVLKQSMEEHDAKFENEEKRLFARAEKHNKWEKKASRRAMMGRQNVLARAGAVVRNSFGDETISETSFGIPNYDSVLEQEAARFQRIQAAKESRLELQRKGYSPEVRRESWEEHASRATRASRFQDVQSEWVDRYVQQYNDDSYDSLDLYEDVRRK